METAMEIALREAAEVRRAELAREERERAEQARAREREVAERTSASLQTVVGQWSADDTVHVDPPLSVQTQTDILYPDQPPQENVSVFQSNQQAKTAAPASASSYRVPARPRAGSRPYGTNTTKATWLFIRDNPGMRRAFAVDALAKLGYHKGSVSSLIGQMVLQAVVAQDAETKGLTVTGTELKPLKSGKERAALVQARIEELRKTNPQRATALERMSSTRAKKEPEMKKSPATKPTDRAEALAKGRRKLAKLRAEARKEGKIYRANPLDKAATKPAKPLRTRRVQAALNGVNIDAAHAKRPLSFTPGVREIVEARTADLRALSANDIVNAMSITQAKEVHKLLEGFFA